MKKKTAKLGQKVLGYKVIETYHIAPDTHVILRNDKYEIRYAVLREWIFVSFHDRKTEKQLSKIKTVGQLKILERLFFVKSKSL